MKYISYVFFLFFTFQHKISAQLRPNKFIRFSVEVKSKEDRYHLNTNDTKTVHAYATSPEQNYAFALGINIYKNCIAEIGYEKQEFELGWRLKTDPLYSASFWHFDRATLIPLRVQYEYIFFSGKKIPIHVTPSAGYVFATGNEAAKRTGDAIDTLIYIDNGLRYFVTLPQIRGVHYDIHKTFGLGEVRLLIEPHLSQNFSLFLSGAYCFGFNVIAKREVYYTVNGVPDDTSVFKSRGSNRYLGIGLKYKIRLKKQTS